MSQFEKPNQSDEELIKLIRQNDPLAFKLLYYRYYNNLFRYAYYRIYSTEVASDLLQDLFVKVWNNRNSLNPDKSVKAYLYRALTNIIINHSKLKSSSNRSLEHIDDHQSAVYEDVDGDIDIRNAINELPEKLKSVFLLSRVEGYKYYEIADILDLSVKAVEKRMTKALSLLRRRFIVR